MLKTLTIPRPWIWALCLAYCTFAQYAEAQLLIGLKAGQNWSEVNFDDVNTLTRFQQRPLEGLAGGLIFQIITSPNVGLQGEILISQQGWSQLFVQTNPDGSIISENTASYQYDKLEIPIMTHIYLGNRRFRYFINLGPHLTYQLGIDSAFSAPNLNPTYRYREVSATNFAYGLSGGVGLNGRIGAGRLQVEGRLAFTLSNLIDRNTTGAPIGSQVQVLRISVSYMTDLSKLFGIVVPKKQAKVGESTFEITDEIVD